MEGSITSPKAMFADAQDEEEIIISEREKIRQSKGYRKRLRPSENLDYSFKIEIAHEPDSERDKDKELSKEPKKEK